MKYSTDLRRDVSSVTEVRISSYGLMVLSAVQMFYAYVLILLQLAIGQEISVYMKKLLCDKNNIIYASSY